MLRFALVVALVAAFTYLTIRFVQTRGMLPPATRAEVARVRYERLLRTRVRPPKPSKSRPIAPDDDEDFLRELDRRRLNPDDPDQPTG